MLLLLRWTATNAPSYSLIDLAKLDGRVAAHLDGLRIAGHEGWKACEEQLAVNEAGEVFAASIMALESLDSSHLGKVLKVVDQEQPLAEGLVSALGWLPLEQARPHIHNFLGSKTPLQMRIGITASAIHRQNPGPVLQEALGADEPLLRARALKAVGELGQTNLLPAGLENISSENPKVRFWSAWAAALMSAHPTALSALQSIAESRQARSEQAMQVLLRRLDSGAAKAWQKQLARQPSHLRLAIQAAGIIGDPEFIPWLIEQMKNLPLARVAGEAFTSITGVGLAFRDLERKPPEDFQAGPTDDPKDENVEMDPDDNLPWPEPTLVADWWQKNQGQFQNGTRYLCGKPMTIEWLKQVLRDGYQRQRAAAALELAIRQPGTPLFNVKAPGFRQIQALGKPGPPIR